MKRFPVLRKAFYVFAAVLCAVIFSSCATIDAVTGDKVYNIYSVQDDIQLGLTAKTANLEELKKEGVKLNADPARVAQIEAITKRIAAVSDMPHLPYITTLVHTNIVNACAFPGGQMMVFEGLYCPKNGLVKDEDELAVVIAHEIAHVNCRHSTKRLSKLMTAGLLAELAATVADQKDNEDVAMAIRAVFAIGTVLWIPMHSRTDEFEADRVGMFYMARAGYDPRAAPRIWKRVAESEGKGWGVLSIFATHPANEARYEALKKMLPYAIEEYVAVVGEYPKGYTPPANAPPPGSFNWRKPPK